MKSAWTGPVFRPNEDGYDEERSSLNYTLTHTPELIVGAVDAGDVVAAVCYAADRGLSVGVQATGHGLVVAADGVLVSTRRMKGVAIDPTARVARVEAGVQWWDVVPLAAAHGLAPLNGSNPHVGVVGYTLGGGIGFLGRQLGFAADHVRSIDVVTSDGRQRRVTPDQNDDLFWALRGSKGNLGIVTEMEFDLFPVETLYGGGLYFGGETTADLLRAYFQWTTDVPEAMSSSIMLMRYPDLEEAPEPLRGRYVAHLRIGYFGPAAEGERLVAPVRDLGPVLLDTVAAMPYSDIAKIHHEPIVPYAAYDRSIYLSHLNADAVEAIIAEAGPDAEAPFLLEFRHLGGAHRRQPTVPNAVGGRDAEFSMFSASLVEADAIFRDKPRHDRLHAAMGPGRPAVPP
jgi:UDP-N-acetylenolpyruvoylglucosamine reductase